MWKCISNWEEYYEINEFGEIRNKLTNHILVGDTNNAGYRRVCLYNKNNIKQKERFFRHRLVASHFLSNEKNLPQVNHKDGNKDNNHISNLEWVTGRENELHSRKILRVKDYKPFIVIFESGYIEFYERKIDFAEKMKFSTSTIKNWLQDKSKTYPKYGIKNILYIINTI